ncbi:hypothetical protein FRC17_001760, partial [Serendipita sp. 399]
AWRDWPAAGCLSWPVGQWTSVPGSITLRFTGVAVYAYGLYDDAQLPQLEVQIDDGTPTKLSLNAPADDVRCDPIYSKTGLSYGNHTIVLRVTNARPDDVKDLSFQGFMVTVPDVNDDVSNSGSGRPRKSRTGLIAAVVAVVAVVIILAIVAFFFWRRRKSRSNKPGPVPTYGPTDPMMNQQKADVLDHSVPPPVPFFLPPSNQPPMQQQQSNSVMAPWNHGSPPTPENNTPYGNTPYNNGQPQPGYFPNGGGQGGYMPPPGGYVPSVTPPAHPTSPSYYGSSSAYSDPNTQTQPSHLSYQPPPSDYSTSMYTANSGYGGMAPPSSAAAEKAQVAAAIATADYAGPSTTTSYTPPPPPHHAVAADQGGAQTHVPYRKGQVNPNAAPVMRTDGQGSSGANAPPPEYGS